MPSGLGPDPRAEAVTVTSPGGPGPRAADFYAVNRGGGLFTEAVNQRLASYMCVVARRLGLAPTALTALNLVLGLAASVTVILTAGPVAHGRVPAWLVGVGALLVWQVAYTLDCADGQLARVTGTGTPAGARVDVLADVALQISLVAAVGTVAVAQRAGIPAWLLTVFAASWMVNLVTSVMAKEGDAGSLVTSSSLPVRVVKLVRDYGAMLTLVGVVLAAVPAAAVWLMVLFSAVNCLFLVAIIVVSARASLRSPLDR